MFTGMFQMYLSGDDRVFGVGEALLASRSEGRAGGGVALALASKPNLHSIGD
jgi:hypothetical protein